MLLWIGGERILTLEWRGWLFLGKAVGTGMGVVACLSGVRSVWWQCPETVLQVAHAQLMDLPILGRVRGGSCWVVPGPGHVCSGIFHHWHDGAVCVCHCHQWSTGCWRSLLYPLLWVLLGQGMWDKTVIT